MKSGNRNRASSLAARPRPRHPRAMAWLMAAFVLALGAVNLSCQGYMSVGVSVPIGGAWGGYGGVGVGVTVPIGR